MYGSGTVEADDVANKNFKVTVNVIHMVSKVTLGALTVSGNANYQFKLTQAFLINVPEKLDFGFTTDGTVTTYQFGGVTSNFFQGESEDVATSTNVTTPEPDLTTRQYRDYLGTENNLTHTVTPNAALGTTYTFYTMPNNSATNDTRLVLKGQWSEDAGTSWENVWYSIQLYNVNTTTLIADNAVLYPNRHYVLNVDIQRKGQLNVADDATGAYNGLSTQSAVNTTYTVSDWTDGSKETTFGGNGGAQAEN